jgi:putative nucleotidyltransferase with HDIG domain
MLKSQMTNPSRTYPLTLSAIFIFILAAQSILFVAHMQAGVLDLIPGWAVNSIGLWFYLMGVLLFAGIFFNYSQAVQKNIFTLSAITLGCSGFFLFQKGLVSESVLLCGMASAFLLSSQIKLEKDWLVETVQWANLCVGIGFLLRPGFMLSAKEYLFFQPQILSSCFAILMLASAAISLTLTRGSASDHYRPKVLAAPWIVWGGMFTIPFFPFNAIVAFGISAGLIFNTSIPWDRIILAKDKKSGRQIIYLLFAFSLISLIIASWLMQVMAGTSALPRLEALHIREIVFIVFATITFVTFIVIGFINASLNKTLDLDNQGNRNLALPEEQPDQERNLVYENLLARQINFERRRTAQLNLLYELNLELGKNVLDPLISAQLTASAIVNAIGSTLVTIFQYDPERDELFIIATSGPLITTVPPGYRQNANQGLIGRAARLRHTQLASNTELDSDYVKLEHQDSLSEIAVPLLAKNKLRGVIAVDHAITNAFDDSDIKTLETAAVLLVTSWERSEHDARLTNLIGAGITLSTTLDVEIVIREIAEIARHTLDARFVFVMLAEKGSGRNRTAHVGYAPTLVSMLNSDPAGNTLVQTALNSPSAFRLRDVRKRFPSTLTGNKDLQSLLAIPILLRELSIGVILAFGKQDNLSFSENDESLASLLTTQAAAAIETTWLYQELRSLFTNTTQLYQLSTRVIQAEQLTDAAASIAETAYQISKAQAAGIVLVSPDGEIEAQVQIDANGIHPGAQHPMDTIKQTMQTGKSIIVSESQTLTRVCLPLQTPRRQYGALWVEVPYEERYPDNLHTLANQAAIALERSILLAETRKQADELESAYHALEATYDQTLAALSLALDARDRETEGHSLRVARLSYRLAHEFGLSFEQCKTLERGAILHDIGKIGIIDSILLKPGPLDDEERQIMRQHPDIGARIVAGIPFLQDAMPVIRYHQECWDGSGYPIGLKETDIPLIARIFSVVDTFDALTTDRPYRSPMPAQEAMEYISSKSGILYDPAIVKIFKKMLDDGIIAQLVNGHAN